jgi:protein arginine N-methyltransferase 1
MYSLRDYGDMISDTVRAGAYAEALRRTVKPGSVVLACQLGAKRVYAIELQEIIQVARENAAVNRCADRIEFIEDSSTSITLPEPVDVIVSDLHGTVSLYSRHIPSIVDARRRFLKPGGVLIPRVETLWAAVVEMPYYYKKIVHPWESNILEIPLGPGRRLAVNDVQPARPTLEELLAPPKLWTTLDYSTIDEPDVSGELSWTIDRDGVGHGIVVWFNSDLADGVSFSNAPGEPDTIYGTLFFPWIHPVQLAKGETVCVQLEAKLTGKDYAWRWATHVKTSCGSGTVREKFDQSTLAGSVLSLEKLSKQASDHIPKLSREGILARRVLELIDSRMSLEEIARKLAAEHPEQFIDWHAAMKIAGGLSRKYSV